MEKAGVFIGRYKFHYGKWFDIETATEVIIDQDYNRAANYNCYPTEVPNVYEIYREALNPPGPGIRL